jgi:hypothetical protein
MAKKRRCIFAAAPDGEGPFYCGHTDDMPALELGIKSIVLGELSDMLNGYDDEVTVEFEVRELTDEEIENLPEL